MVERAFDGDTLSKDEDKLLNDVITSCVPTQEEVSGLNISVAVVTLVVKPAPYEYDEG